MESASTAFKVSVDSSRTVGATLYRAASEVRLGATLILGHGAGAGQESPFMVEVSRALAARGVDVVTFNFHYIESRRRVPDTNAVLEATWHSVIAAVAGRDDVGSQPLFIGGKSMGGRIASQVAAAPGDLAISIAGLVFLGYPLHPPGKPEQRRDAHLPAVRRPMLFVQGERDAFGSAEELHPLVASLAGAELYVVAGANHSLEPPKRGEKSREAVLNEIEDHTAAWIMQARPL